MMLRRDFFYRSALSKWGAVLFAAFLVFCIAHGHAFAHGPMGVLAPGSRCPGIKSNAGLPEYAADPTLDINCRRGFAFGYSEERRVPLWVVEYLQESRLTAYNASRKSCRFQADERLRSTSHVPAELTDYAKTVDANGRSYDRGHMAPAANMVWEAVAMEESCWLSNITPQHGIGMNRHIWAELEKLTRDWACDYDGIETITGPIYDKNPPDTLGVNAVHIPTAFYKILYSEKNGRALAFILENKAIDKQGQKTVEFLKSKRVAVTDVESRTGLMFFTNMSPREKTILAGVTGEIWKVGNGCKKRSAK